MNRLKIEVSPAASRDLGDLEMRVAIKVLSYLTILEENPFPRGKLIKKIKGKKTAFYRLRFDKFKVFFEIQPKKVIILRVLSEEETDRFTKRF